MPDATHGACEGRRMQSIVDIIVSVALTMLAWPSPLARAWLTPAAHAAGVLAACVVVQLAYYTGSVLAWRQTLGMRLAGLRLSSAGEAPLTWVQGLKWGLVSAVLAPWYAIAPRSACSAAVAEKASGTRLAQV